MRFLRTRFLFRFFSLSLQKSTFFSSAIEEYTFACCCGQHCWKLSSYRFQLSSVIQSAWIFDFESKFFPSAICHYAYLACGLWTVSIILHHLVVDHIWALIWMLCSLWWLLSYKSMSKSSSLRRVLQVKQNKWRSSKYQWNTGKLSVFRYHQVRNFRSAISPIIDLEICVYVSVKYTS